MLQQPRPLDGQGDSPGPLQLSQLGVIPTQWTMEALVSDYCSAIHSLSPGNLSIAPWVRVSLIWQGNLAGSALLLCYWVSPWQSFIALLHQNIYCLISYTCSLHLTYLLGCIIGVTTQCICKHIVLALYIDKFHAWLILAQLLLPSGLPCSHLFWLTKVDNQWFVISVSHKVMTQQYILEMVKTIHNCKSFPICCTILTLSII